MKQYFRVEESAYHAPNSILIIDDTLLDLHGAPQSLHIICARVLGISYPTFLRLARDQFGATLFGKRGFPIALFPDKNKAHQLADLLNKQTDLILSH